MAVAAYRRLLRSTALAFSGDSRMLAASRAEARKRFNENRNLDPHSQECTKALDEAEGVSMILRQNIVQGAGAQEGDSFRLRIHEETEKGDNDTVKNAGNETLGGQKCCSS